MPELPEVETVRRGLAPHLVRQKIHAVQVFEPRLRWPVPAGLAQALRGQVIHSVERRSKYLLIRFARETLLIHLGMSGSLRLVSPDEARRRHDHVDFELSGGSILRYHDPRRFGAILLAGVEPYAHALLRNLGPEPLTDAFNGAHLHARSRGRRVAVKVFLMDAAQVVGVGNIYASESLHVAGIRPTTPCGRISRQRYDVLAKAVKLVLTDSIAQGGTTLRDFVNGNGRPGYFAQRLAVYGREGQPCPRCGGEIRARRLGQRSTFWCPDCQR